MYTILKTIPGQTDSTQTHTDMQMFIKKWWPPKRQKWLGTNTWHFQQFGEGVTRGALTFNSRTSKMHPFQQGLNHVCVILSRLYVSCLCDTSFETSFRHRKKYLVEVLSFGLCNSECIRSKNPFRIIFGTKNFS